MDPQKYNNAIQQPYNSPSAAVEQRLVVMTVVVAILTFIAAVCAAIIYGN
jgi:hypothetical protein